MIKILQSRGFAIFIKALASLASAIFVINGYFILTNKKNAQEEELPEDSEGNREEGEVVLGEAEAVIDETNAEEAEERKKKGSLHHLFRRRS